MTFNALTGWRGQQKLIPYLQPCTLILPTPQITANLFTILKWLLPHLLWLRPEIVFYILCIFSHMCQEVRGRNNFPKNNEKEKGCGGGVSKRRSEMGQRKSGEVGKRWPNEMLVAESWFGRREEPAGVDGGMQKLRERRGKWAEGDRLSWTGCGRLHNEIFYRSFLLWQQVPSLLGHVSIGL